MARGLPIQCGPWPIHFAILIDVTSDMPSVVVRVEARFEGVAKTLAQRNLPRLLFAGIWIHAEDVARLAAAYLPRKAMPPLAEHVVHAPRTPAT